MTGLLLIGVVSLAGVGAMPSVSAFAGSLVGAVLRDATWGRRIVRRLKALERALGVEVDDELSDPGRRGEK